MRVGVCMSVFGAVAVEAVALMAAVAMVAAAVRSIVVDRLQCRARQHVCNPDRVSPATAADTKRLVGKRGRGGALAANHGHRMSTRLGEPAARTG